MIQPPSCEKHEQNELGCVECTVKRTVFYENAIADAILYPESYDEELQKEE